MTRTILQADARRLPLADASVHMVVTSPPYFGQRDYGTAQWGGGDPSCDHAAPVDAPNGNKGQPVTHPGRHGRTCRKCGAERVDNQIGLEPTPDAYIAEMVKVFREVRRVLRDDGTLWLNVGDSYASGGRKTRDPGQSKIHQAFVGDSYREGLRPADPEGIKPKDLLGVPWLLAFALRADGWYLRQDIIWSKPNPMPESVRDRCTKAHEYIFLLTKKPRYFYDADAIREPVTSTGGASFGKQNHDPAGTLAQSRRLSDPSERNHPLGRNKRDVWTISTQACPEAHFATYPVKLPLLCIQAGTSERGCCPTCGAGWVRETKRNAATDGRAEPGERIYKHRGRLGHQAKTPSGLLIARATTGFRPACACPPHEPIPCTVFDPFHGAGTTAIAAEMLGRSYVGTELKREYIDLSLKRIEKHRRKRAEKKHGKPRKPKCTRTPSLFPEAA